MCQNNRSIVALFLVYLIAMASFIYQPAFSGDTKEIDELLQAITVGSELKIVLENSSKISGTLISLHEDEIVLDSGFGKLTIPIDKIEMIDESHYGDWSGDLWHENLNSTRLFFAPTARTLKAGQGYFSDIYMFFPSVAFGLTDNISFGMGMSLFPGGQIDEQIYFFTPKIGFKAGSNLDLSISAFIIRAPDDLFLSDDSKTLGLLYGMGTYGDSDKSLTFGLGYGLKGNEIADKPAVILGGEIRISRRVALVSENWVLPGADYLLTFNGLRFFGRGIAVDLALVNRFDDNPVWPGIPYLDFVVHF